MQGMFSGAGNQTYSERNDWMQPGFDGDVRIIKTSAQNTRDHGLCYVIDFEIVTSNAHPAHPPGAKHNRFIKVQKNRETALAESMGVAMCAMGVDAAGLTPDMRARLEQLLEQSANPQYETANPLIGRTLHLRTTQKELKRTPGKIFTLHNWSLATNAAGPAYNPAAHPVPPPAPPPGPPPQWPGAAQPPAQAWPPAGPPPAPLPPAPAAPPGWGGTPQGAPPAWPQPAPSGPPPAGPPAAPQGWGPPPAQPPAGPPAGGFQAPPFNWPPR